MQFKECFLVPTDQPDVIGAVPVSIPDDGIHPEYQWIGHQSGERDKV